MNRLTALTATALALLFAAPPLAAAPSDYARVVADGHRAEASRKLDEGRMPAAVLDFAGFKPGQTIVDFQAGGGYYSELLAKVVGPRGHVLATTQPNFYDKDEWARLTKGYPNVWPMVVPGEAMQLAPGSVDAIFAHLVYHDLYWVSDKYRHPRLDVPSVVAGWFSAVKPGGTVVIVDHAGPAGDPREVVEKMHRIDPARVKADMAAAGFELVAESAVLHRSDDPHTANVFDPSVRGKTDRFMMKFRKPA